MITLSSLKCVKVLLTINKCSDDIHEWFPHIEISFAFSCNNCNSLSKHFVPLKFQELTPESQVHYSFNHDEKYWLKAQVSLLSFIQILPLYMDSHHVYNYAFYCFYLSCSLPINYYWIQELLPFLKLRSTWHYQNYFYFS